MILGQIMRPQLVKQAIYIQARLITPQLSKQTVYIHARFELP